MELGIAAGALALSLIVFVRQIVRDRRQDEMQRRLAAIEEERRTEEVESRLGADVTAEVQREASNGFIVVTNRGPSAAEDIHFTLVDAETAQDAMEVLFRDRPPLHVLDAAQSYRFPAGFTMDVAPPFLITLSWTDGTGARQKTLRIG